MNPKSPSHAVYVISVAAEIAGVHPQTLRIYERKGLLCPARTGGGSRRYSDADLSKLGRILELTDEGLNLAGVKRVLALENELDETKKAMNELRIAAKEAVNDAHRQHRREIVPVTKAVTVYKRRR